MAAQTKFIDNSALVLKNMGTNSKEAMDAAADLLVDAIQGKILYGYKDLHGNPPHTEIVDTGKLFDSISAKVTRSSQNLYSVDAGANTNYAVYVHEGTYKLKGRPFITDAVTESQGELKTLLASGLSRGMK